MSACETCGGENPGPYTSLCSRCYKRSRPKPAPVASSCHPETTAYRKGLCSVCYRASKATGQAACHPEKPVHAKGLCANCYTNQWNTPEYRKKQNAKPENVAARAAYAKTDKGRAKNAESVARTDPTGEKRRAYGLAWSRLNYVSDKNRTQLLKRKYGITQADYDIMFAAQNGVCAICETTTPGGFSGKRAPSFAVDHCHDSGRVRGLLCMHCNQAIGKFNHDVAVLSKAIDYLKSHQPGPVYVMSTAPCAR